VIGNKIWIHHFQYIITNSGRIFGKGRMVGEVGGAIQSINFHPRTSPSWNYGVWVLPSDEKFLNRC